MDNPIFSVKNSHQELILRLYKQQKCENAKFSLAYLCRRSEIPSKGYLGDVMKSKRRLSPKYALPLGRALGLAGPRLKFFQLLVSRDHERDPLVRAKFEKKLAAVEKALRTKRPQLKGSADLRFISRVFCLFGLIQPPVTLRKLQVTLPDFSEQRIQMAISQLESLGTVTRVKEGYLLADTQFVFPSADDPRVASDFFQASMFEAAAALPKWFPRPAESFFQSTFVSVKREVYLEKMQEMKDFFDEYQSDLESEEADLLVCFNIQVYPDSSPVPLKP